MHEGQVSDYIIYLNQKIDKSFKMRSCYQEQVTAFTLLLPSTVRGPTVAIGLLLLSVLLTRTTPVTST